MKPLKHLTLFKSWQYNQEIMMLFLRLDINIFRFTPLDKPLLRAHMSDCIKQELYK